MPDVLRQRSPARFDGYRIFYRYQDSGWEAEHETYPTKEAAKKALKKKMKYPLSCTVMYKLIAPDGEVLY